MPTEPLPFIRAALARQPDGDGLRKVVADAAGGAAFPENDLQKQLRENEPLLLPWRVGR